MSPALGRGLSSLIPNKQAERSHNTTPEPRKQNSLSDPVHDEVPGLPKDSLLVRLDQVEVNPDQPRKHFEESALEELTASIREHGVLQPLLVQETEDGRYQIIAGERRFQASRRAGLEEVPVVVKKVSDQQNLEMALVENIQRHDLNAIEEAKAFQRLHDDFGLSQADVAKKVGKSRAAVANTMRLLELPEEVKRGLSKNKISEGHARAILAAEGKEKQIAVYHEVVSGGLTVRETEKLARGGSQSKTSKRRATAAALDPQLEARLQEVEREIGTKITLAKSQEGGKVGIRFFSDEELRAFLDRLSS